MTTTQKFLKQLENEAVVTRKMLSIIPDDQLDWQPHPKSMTLRALATHVAEISGWVTIAMDTSGLDLANNPYEPTKMNSRAELLAFFEERLAAGCTSLQKATDDDLAAMWTMSYGDKVISVSPKENVIQSSINQIIHHRAQLGVFLRLLNVPIPGTYGPSADEMTM